VTGGGATAPEDDHRAALLALRSQIEGLRRDVDRRLDVLAEAVEQLLPVSTKAPLGHAAPLVAAAPGAMTNEQAALAQHRRAPEGVGRAPTVRVGDDIYVPRLGGTYAVVEVAPSGQSFKVQAGAMRVELRVDEVWPLDDAVHGDKGTPLGTTHRPTTPARGGGYTGPSFNPHIPEIDLHGYSERDALVTLELFLHHAFTERILRVRIIHGKGNGILRAAVRRELDGNHLVRSTETEPYLRGDDGVTIANLDL